MAETLAYNFVGNDELSRVFEALDRVAGKLDRTLNQLGDQASQAGRKLGAAGAGAKGAGEEVDGLGDDAAKAGRKIDELGDDMDKAALKAVVFEAQMRLAKRSVKELTDEFVKTGDVDVLKKLGNSQSHLAGLEKEFKKTFEHVAADAEQAGQEAGKTFSASMQGTLKTPGIGPALTAVLVAGAIVAAPAIGAAVTSAVLLGVGGGTLAAGIALAAKDPRVSDAWSQFGKSAKDKLAGAASVFVDPLIRGTQTFGATLDAILPRIRRDFDLMAPSLDRLFVGFGGLVEKAMPGFDAALAASQPFIDELAREMPNIGSAISDFFQTIASDSPGALQFFHEFLRLTEMGIQVTGDLIGGLSVMYGTLRGLSDAMSGNATGAYTMWQSWQDGATGAGVASLAASSAIAAVKNAIVPAGQEASISASQFKTLSQQINATRQDADTLAGQMTDKLMGSLLGMGHATLGVAESLTNLESTFDQNGRSIDRHTGLVAMNTQGGQRNREAVLSAIEANLRQYDVMIQSGASAEQATEKYNTNTEALRGQLRQAHLTEKQINDLIGEYGNVPAKVNTDIATKGLTTAIENLDALMRRINNIPTRKDIYVTQHLGSVGSFYQSPDRLFDYPGAAYGGRVGKRAMGGGVYDVGENGPERVVLPDNAYVIPNNQMSRGSGPEVLDAVDVPLRLRDSVTGDVVVNALLRLSKQRGRTVAQLLQIA